MSGPFKMKGNPLKRNFDFKSKKKKNIRDWSTDIHGEKDFSKHNIHARKTEGTIAQQDALRRKRGM
jgi:hypothetical protein